MVRNDIVDRFEPGDRSWFRAEDHNLFADGNGDGAHDISRAPRFAAGWRLAAGSAGIDAAESGGAPARDRVGHPRIDDSAVPDRVSGPNRFTDMGAYERRP